MFTILKILNAEILLNVQNNLNHNIFSDIKKIQSQMS